MIYYKCNKHECILFQKIVQKLFLSFQLLKLKMKSSVTMCVFYGCVLKESCKKFFDILQYLIPAPKKPTTPRGCFLIFQWGLASGAWRENTVFVLFCFLTTVGQAQALVQNFNLLPYRGKCPVRCGLWTDQIINFSLARSRQKNKQTKKPKTSPPKQKPKPNQNKKPQEKQVVTWILILVY